MHPVQESRTRDTIRASDKWTVLCLVFLLLACTEFLFRGPIRAIRVATAFNDFLSPYIQAKAWIHGVNPYSPETLLRMWPTNLHQPGFLAKEVADGSLLAKRGMPTAYPVTSLVLIAPFTVLPWMVANALWLAINLGFFATML